MSIEKIGVVGAGAWGTALAQTLAKAGRDVCLWSFEPELVSMIGTAHENRTYLPGVRLDKRIKATGDLGEVANRDALLMVVPAQFMADIARELARHLAPDTPLVICSKGIEIDSGRLLTQVLAEALPKARLAALSGPTFAIEVANGLPGAVTLACEDKELAGELAKAINHRNLRVYLSSDLIGVEVGGAIKNVLAIAAGIVEGKKLGKSAHAALITRGFAEMTRFGRALGARRETLEGLSGLGDLVLTCSSPTSRNMSFGRALGEGQSVADILAARKAVTEGMYTAIPVVRIAQHHGIEMPICEAVRNIIWGGNAGEGEELEQFPALSVDDAIEGLLSRPMRAEEE